MVPNGWSVFPLDQVSKIIDCKHRTPKYVKEGIPLVSPGTIKWGPIDLDSPTKRVTNEEYASLMDHCSVDIGDLVLSRNQSVGIASYVDKSEPFVLGQDTVLVKPNGCDASYLFYNLQSVNTQRVVFKLAGGSTFSRINLGEIRKLKSIYPPLPEQRKIAQILLTWDKAIATTEKLIDASKQQKKALMQQLLAGKKRLVDPETGKAFEGDWEEVKFSTFGKCIRGVSYKPTQISENENENTIRLLRSTNIQEGKLNDKDLVILPREVVKPAQLMIKNDLAICMANGSKLLVGKSAPFNGNERAYTVGAFCAIFRPTKTYSHSLVQHVFNSAQYRHQLKVILAGSAINNLKGSDIESMVITLPVNIEEQQKIASVLTAADNEIELLETKLAHLKLEKKALMQQLLTGKRRVQVSETEAA